MIWIICSLSTSASCYSRRSRLENYYQVNTSKWQTVFTTYNIEVNYFNWKSKHAKCPTLCAWLSVLSVMMSLLIGFKGWLWFQMVNNEELTGSVTWRSAAGSHNLSESYVSDSLVYCQCFYPVTLGKTFFAKFPFPFSDCLAPRVNPCVKIQSSYSVIHCSACSFAKQYKLRCLLKSFSGWYHWKTFRF